jgi:hypothetical protein
MFAVELPTFLIHNHNLNPNLNLDPLSFSNNFLIKIKIKIMIKRSRYLVPPANLYPQPTQSNFSLCKKNDSYIFGI